MLQYSVKEAQRGFFDRESVQTSVDKAARKVLSKFGAFVRRRAQTSMKPAPKRGKGKRRTAEPGKPPFYHLKLIRKFLFFAWDPQAKSVVIGPAKLNKPGQAPALLEHGGDSEDGHYEGNPYMGPALEAELPGLPDLWRNSVKR